MRAVVKAGSGVLVPEARIYKSKVLELRKRQMRTSSFRDVLFGSQDVPGETGNYAATDHGQGTQRSVSERVQEPKQSEMCCNIEPNSLQSLFAGSMQVYMEKTATTSKLSELGTHSLNAVRLTFRTEEERYLATCA